MPFVVGNDVFAISIVDTGEVERVRGPQINMVAYDQLPGSGEHHDDDLRLIPFEGRIYKQDYYYIVKAAREGNRRVHETICLRHDGRRIYRRKSPK